MLRLLGIKGSQLVVSRLGCLRGQQVPRNTNQKKEGGPDTGRVSLVPT